MREAGARVIARGWQISLSDAAALAHATLTRPGMATAIALLSFLP